MARSIGRRTLLACGAGAVLLWRSGASAAARLATPRNELGPFYCRCAPHVGLLRRAGDEGLPLDLAAGVYRVSGEPVAGARIRA